ncbi:tonB-dependent receptor [Streptomyces laurentii]|uniref:TonB-dependent receptor n=1 Tax=Streptomyces laurentii TaxID=39478 RepID=A0A169PPU9_STRLU|nr:tonB-dependent receptor [Streptomyces laurentii]
MGRVANPKSTIKAVGVRVEPDPTNPAPLKDAIYCSLNGTYNSMVQRQAGEESRLGQLGSVLRRDQSPSLPARRGLGR